MGRPPSPLERPLRLTRRLPWLRSLLLLCLLLQLHLSPAAGSRKPFRVTRTVTTTAVDDPPSASSSAHPSSSIDLQPVEHFASDTATATTAPHLSFDKHSSAAPEDSGEDEDGDMQQQQPHLLRAVHPSSSSPRPSSHPSPTTGNLSDAPTADLSTAPSSSFWSPYLYPVLALSSLLSLSTLAYLYYRYRTTPRSLSSSPDSFHHRTLIAQLSTPRGRLQGLDWAVQALRWDDDGDCAHDFLGPFVLTEDRERREREARATGEGEEPTAAGGEDIGVVGQEEASGELKGTKGRAVRRRKRKE